MAFESINNIKAIVLFCIFLGACSNAGESIPKLITERTYCKR